MAMNKVSRIVSAWVTLLLILSGGVGIQAASDVGRTAADFLMIGHGAHAAAMGGAFTAMSSEVTSAYWNPAGLSSLERAGVSFGHFSWYQDITVEQISFGLPVNDRFSGAVSATYVNYGTIDGYDAQGDATGDLVAYDWVGGISMAMALSESFAIGVTGKYVNQRLDDVSASAFAADLGIRYSSESFAVGVTVVNLGSDIKFNKVSEKLPAATRLGLMFRPLSGAVATTFELEQRFYGDLVLRQGLELGFEDTYYLRAGYDYVPAQDGRQLATGMSAGAGLRLGFADIDYAFTPNDKSTSEDLHRFTLTFLLGSK
jgi:hypothetical protein